jgi:hypothetical protein
LLKAAHVLQQYPDIVEELLLFYGIKGGNLFQLNI